MGLTRDCPTTYIGVYVSHGKALFNQVTWPPSVLVVYRRVALTLPSMSPRQASLLGGDENVSYQIGLQYIIIYT